MKHCLFFFFLILGFISCSSDQENVISKKEMADILYDMHVAKYMNENSNGDDQAFNEISNRTAILKKYGVTEAEWDSSFNYYARNTPELCDIYNNISERLRNEVVALGGSIAFGSDSANGDTTNIWNGENSFLLMHQAPLNLRSFTFSSDSTFKAGDHVALQLNTKFLFQEGMHDVVATIAMTFDNDSVTTTTRHITQDGPTNISISDNEHLGIKSVRGYILLYQNMNDQPSTTFRLAVISNVRMVVTHEDEEARKKEQEKERQDSINASIQHGQSDSLMPLQKHQLTPQFRSIQRE